MLILIDLIPVLKQLQCKFKRSIFTLWQVNLFLWSAIIISAIVPGCFSGLAKINWPCTCSTHTKFRL